MRLSGRYGFLKTHLCRGQPVVRNKKSTIFPSSEIGGRSLREIRHLDIPVTEAVDQLASHVLSASVHAASRESYCTGMVSFTAATSCAKVNGFGRKANCSFSGRLFSKASSA
jgi:hypothetical protein